MNSSGAIPQNSSRIVEDAKASEIEAAAVVAMLQMGIAPQEVADWTMAARKRRENTDKRTGS